MTRCLVLVSMLCLLVSCGAPPTSSPDLVATQIAVEEAAHATMTARAPTATNTPAATDTLARTATGAITPMPTDTLIPTTSPTETPSPTKTPTNTSAPTWTPVPEPTYTPEPKPTRKPKPPPTEDPRQASTPEPELVVSFRDFHYECEKTWNYSIAADKDFWCYRSFQALMYITNISDRTVEPPWKPSRWIIAHWRNPDQWRESTLMWEWYQPGKEWHEPPIGPGGTAYWTYVAMPIDRWEFVKAAEFDRWGQTYRFEFPRPEYVGQFNFIDCGDYPAGARDPIGNTPTP